MRILLVEDNPHDARLLQESLAAALQSPPAISWVQNLSDALRVAAENRFDCVLLDLRLPDSAGIDTVARFLEAEQFAPIVVLTGSRDEVLGVSAVRMGAQDYLVKDATDISHLVRALQFASERYRLQSHLREQAIVDPLTGLYNRRGFLTLAGPQMKLAKRKQNQLVLLFIDLDGLKEINDNYGHAEGDRALVDVAKLLATNFRESDVVARIGGDEFAVLALKGPDSRAEAMRERLYVAVERLNEGRKPAIGLSVGLYDVANEETDLDEILTRADESMYAEKRARREGRR
jgi:diguanylate cyclase (GGDEF)-like protein